MYLHRYVIHVHFII